MREIFIGLAAALLLATISAAGAGEFHVAVTGDDGNPGTAAKPLRTIQRAAERAMPGDVITVHEGIYREFVRPPRGGESDARRIVYQAAPGEKVEIKGSEVVKDWASDGDDVWKATLPNSFFGDFNPYGDLIRGDWFDPKGRSHHTGAVYLNGDWLAEAAAMDDLRKPDAPPLWFGRVDEATTTIWARFPKVDPNGELVEINVRRAVFYPERTGCDFITVRGFAMRQAATPWAPPTAEQVGLIGTHWSKGWIIENNVVSHSICSGIALGKYGDEWDNTSADTAEGYVKTIERALKNGWARDKVGHHVVRGNTISHCEQAGIVGSLGPIFSVVENNTIHDIHVRRAFAGAEQSAIKFHGAVDVQIRNNHIYQSIRGVWLDWMAQGARVSGNLLHDNKGEDLFVEVNHGPFLVDNNVMLSPTSVLDVSEGGAYVHNLMAGRLVLHPDPFRETPFLKAHSTELAGLSKTPGGDDRFLNNIFIGPSGLDAYDQARPPMMMAGNLFLKGARPSKHETNPQVDPAFDPAIKLIANDDGWRLEMKPRPTAADATPRQRVDAANLGRTRVADLPFEGPEGAPLKLDVDYFGKPRPATNPAPGPFEGPAAAVMELR